MNALDMWREDPEFNALPEHNRTQKYTAFFEQYIADDEFRSLPAQEQNAIFGGYLRDQEVTPVQLPGLYQAPERTMWQKAKDKARELREKPTPVLGQSISEENLQNIKQLSPIITSDESIDPVLAMADLTPEEAALGHPISTITSKPILTPEEEAAGGKAAMAIIPYGFASTVRGMIPEALEKAIMQPITKTLTGKDYVSPVSEAQKIGKYLPEGTQKAIGIPAHMVGVVVPLSVSFKTANAIMKAAGLPTDLVLSTGPVADQIVGHIARGGIAGAIYGGLEGGTPKDMAEDAAFFGALEGGLGITGRIFRKIFSSNWYRNLEVKEHGLVIQSLDDAIKRNPNLTEGELLRKWNNPTWRKEALAVRAKGEQAVTKPVTPDVPTKQPTTPFVPARVLPPGQGFGLVKPKPEVRLRPSPEKIEGPTYPEGAEYVAGKAAPEKPSAAKEPTYIRIEEFGKKPDISKPQGLYIVNKGKEALIEGLDGTRYEYTFTPKNSLKVEKELSVKHDRFKGFEEGPASSGIKALRKLVGIKEFDRLMQLSKKDLLDELGNKYPSVNWGKYYDSYEMLEGYAGKLAKDKGYDSIVGDTEEVVALKPQVLTEAFVPEARPTKEAKLKAASKKVKAETPTMLKESDKVNDVTLGTLVDAAIEDSAKALEHAAEATVSKAKLIEGLKNKGLKAMGEAKTKEERAEIKKNLEETLRGIEKGKFEIKKVYDFSSTQVDLPKSETKAIRKFISKIPDSEIYEDPKDPSYGREDSPHITVKYGLHTNRAEEVESLLQNINPITIKMGKISIFENTDNDYDVVKVDVESPELHALNKKIADNLEVTDTYPTYQPHMTLAYVKKGGGEKYKRDTRFEGKEITLDTLTFSGKDGSEKIFDLKPKPKESTKKKEPAPREPEAKYATEPTEPFMYSTLTQAAESPKFPETLPAKSVINQLKKAPGVKQAEIDTVGLAEWLEGKEKIFRAELVDFLRMNEVRVEGVEKEKAELDPTDNEIKAIQNTEGAILDDKGLTLDVVRYQKTEQSGELSIRAGVFFLPEKNSPYKKYYTTGKMGYGGSERSEGKTTYRNPIMVKAASGGRAPKLAYDSINGKGAYEKMRSDVLDNAWSGNVFNRRPDEKNIYKLLEKYGGIPDLAWTIADVSTKGNTLPYAIQEHVVASSVRKAGYDAVIGYNKIGGKLRLSEVFDVRPARYPSKTAWEHYFEEFYDTKESKPSSVIYEPTGKYRQSELDLAFGGKKKADEAIESVAKEVEAVSRRRMPDRVAGKPVKSGVAEEMRKNKHVDLTGRKLTKGKESQEIAELFQVYRSPKMEILHAIYTSKDGTILGHNAMTSGDMGAVSPGDRAKYIYRMQSTAKRLGAAKVHILHNHPSGNPTMSQDDVSFATALHRQPTPKRNALGDLMGEFIVIDHGKFTWVSEYGKDRIYTAVDEGTYKVTPYTGKWMLKKGPLLTGPEATAALGQSLAYDKSKACFVYVDGGNNVVGWSTHDKDILKKENLREIVKQQAKGHNANKAVILIHDIKDAKRVVTWAKPGLESWLLDVQDAEGYSLREAFPLFFERRRRREPTKPAWGLFEPEAEYGKKVIRLKSLKSRSHLSKYQKENIAWEPNKIDFSKEGLSNAITRVYTAFKMQEYPAVRLAGRSGSKKAVTLVEDQIRRLRGRGGLVEEMLEGKGPFRVINYGTPQEQIQYVKNAKSLKKILSDIQSREEYFDYESIRVAERDVALAIHRPDVKGTDLKASRAEIIRVEAKYSPEDMTRLRRISKEHRIFERQAILRPLVDVGWMSQKAYNAILKKPESEYYASFAREMDEVEGYVLGGKDPVKKIKGSERKKVPSVEATIANVYKTVRLVESLKLNKEIIKLREISPDLAEIIKEVKPSPLSRNTIIVPENGIKYYYKVPSDVFKAIDYYSPKEINMAIKLMAYPARWLRAGATLSAEFMMRNPVRDQFTAYAYSNYGYLPHRDFPKGLYHLLKKTDLYHEYIASGSEQSYFVSLDRQAVNVTTRKLVGWKAATPKDVITVLNPIEAMREISMFMEKGTRIGLYAIAKKGKATPSEAMREAREGTLDFGRIGTIRSLNQIIAFWNANVEGIDRMVRAFKNNPGRTLMKTTLGITIPSIVLWFLYHDDERIKELPEWRKNFCWNIPIKNGPIVSFPKPFELGIIFGSLPERILDHVYDKDPEALRSISKAIKDGAAPGLMPTAGLPLIENITNYSFFMDRPLETEATKKLPHGMRAHQYTSELAKKTGKLTDVSPIKIDNWIRSWTGTLGKQALDISNVPLGKDSTTKIEKKWYEITPGIKGFIAKEPIGSAGISVERFYRNMQKCIEAESGRKILDTVSKKESDKFNAETHGIGDYAKMARKVAGWLGSARKEKARIMQDKILSPREKRKKIEKIDREMTQMAKDFNEFMQ